MSERPNKKLYNERQAARHALALMTKLAPGDEVVHIVNGTTGKVVEVEVGAGHLEDESGGGGRVGL